MFLSICHLLNHGTQLKPDVFSRLELLLLEILLTLQFTLHVVAVRREVP